MQQMMGTDLARLSTLCHWTSQFSLFTWVPLHGSLVMYMGALFIIHA